MWKKAINGRRTNMAFDAGPIAPCSRLLPWSRTVASQARLNLAFQFGWLAKVRKLRSLQVSRFPGGAEGARPDASAGAPAGAPLDVGRAPPGFVASSNLRATTLMCTTEASRKNTTLNTR